MLTIRSGGLSPSADFFLRMDTWAAPLWYGAILLLVAVIYALVLTLSTCKAKRQPGLVEGVSASQLVSGRDTIERAYPPTEQRTLGY